MYHPTWNYFAKGVRVAERAVQYAREYPRARERLYLLDEFDQIREYFGDV